MQVSGCICWGNLKPWHCNWRRISRCATSEREALKVTWKSWLFRLLQIYSAAFLPPISSLGHPSDMPRSFLVRSKRAHLLSPPKDYYRQQFQHHRDAEKPEMGLDSRHPEGAVQPLSPMLGVRDLLTNTHSARGRIEDGSRSAPTDELWPSGMKHFLTVKCVLNVAEFTDYRAKLNIQA